MSPRHGMDGDEDTVEGLRAQRDQLAAELVAALAQLDRIGASAGFAVTSDGTGPLPAVPPQRPRSRHAARATHLRLVKLLIPGAALGALKYAWHAHRVATVAAGVLTAGAVTTTAAVVAPHGVVAQVFGAGASGTPAPAASIYSAIPIAGQQPAPLPSSQLRLAGAVTRPKTSAITALPFITAAPPQGSYTRVPAPGAPAPQPQQGPVPQGPGSQQPPPAPSGPPVLDPVAATLDLSAGGSQVITLTATGDGGWVSWSVSTVGSDLDFSATRGVLRAGQSVSITVSVDQAQATDGNLSQTFSINGQQVTVTLPAPPPPPPAPAPTDTPASVPAPLPT